MPVLAGPAGLAGHHALVHVQKPSVPLHAAVLATNMAAGLLRYAERMNFLYYGVLRRAFAQISKGSGAMCRLGREYIPLLSAPNHTETSETQQL